MEVFNNQLVMRQNIRLYIEENEVEFSTVPQILYTYKETDLRNPTIVKNSFSKTIEVEGTPANNDLFGHIWDLERYQGYGGFNPSKRADFKLFVNGELYEKGYCKLDSIRKTGTLISYSISLYGGLGQLLYHLQNGGGDNKLTLADLEYTDYYADNIVNLDFTINKNTVQEAWEQLNGHTDQNKKWNYINFAVCSEGIPEDFSADRVLFNNEGRSLLTTESNGHYTVLGGEVQSGSTLGYSLIETKNELTMDTSFDLRSYLLRPVVSVRGIIDAIRLPQNNGGWDIKLDSHFFDYQNPYYANAWLTLNRFKDLNIEKVSGSTVTATLTKADNHHYNVNFTKPSSVENVRIKYNVTMSPSTTTSATKLWPATMLETNLTYHNRDWLVKEFDATGGLVVWLEALDANNNVLSKGKPVLIFSDEWGRPVALLKLWEDGGGEGDIEGVPGHFEKKSGTWVFCDRDGNTIDLTTTLSSNVNYSRVRLAITNPYQEYTRYTKGWIQDKGNYDGTTPDLIPSNQYFYTSARQIWEGEHTKEQCKAHNSVQGQWGLRLVEVRPETMDYEGFFSNTFISKEKLLRTSFTPADFLLDYCKLFGLYLYCDPTEVSADEQIFPMGVVHILDRNTFFTDEYVNVNELIDRSKAITINPRTAESKWYSFSYEGGEGDAEKKYNDNYGYSYGRQLINTNSDFNAEVKELYDGSIFKNGVMVREKSRYFGTASDIVGAYMYDGFTYHLFQQDGDEFNTNDLTFAQKKNAVSYINNYNLPYYDSMPKLQIHNNENGEEDGSGILLFFTHFVNTVTDNGGVVDYYITDDVGDMAELNDGSPCWLNTTSTTDGKGNIIAIKRNSLPFFTRDIYDSGEQGNIVHSWNFGHPQDTFVPRTYSTEYDSIYDMCWREYIADLYDVNTKVVKANMFITERPNPSWLRRYYWWDNSLWRINTLEWNVATYDSSPVEFIKVQDPENYKLAKINYTGRLRIVLDDYEIGKNGGTITGKVLQQSSTEHWAFTDYLVGTYPNGDVVYLETDTYVSPVTGTGVQTNITITVPANASALPITWAISALDSDDHRFYAYFTQEGDNSPYLDFAPQSKNVEVGVNAQTYVLYFVAENIRPNSITASLNSPEWVSVVSVDEANSAITLSVSASSMSGLRTAQITINGIGINGAVVNNQTLFKQVGSDIDVDYASVTFNYNETGTNRVQIITSSNWTATINDSNGQ